MKTPIVKISLTSSLMLAAILLTATLNFASAATHVAATRGIAEPPFLSLGIKSNLLMLLDNSGSMLDMAHVDSDIDGTGTDSAMQCFDEGFLVDPETGALNTTLEYAGVFQDIDDVTKQQVWYKWVDGVEPWKIKTYSVNNLVTSEGITYRAQTAGTSTGDGVFSDTGVKWESVLQPQWHAGRWYHTGSFVFTETKQVYRSTSSGTSAGTGPTADSGVNWVEVPRYVTGNAYAAGAYVLGQNLQLFLSANAGTANGARPTEDTVVKWTPVDYYAWKAGVAYAFGEIATHEGMLYLSQAQHTASGATIYEDSFSSMWHRIDEGYFSALTETEAKNFCSAATGTHHGGVDVCVTINSLGGKEYVSAFAASANFLNWASASKFDIQKKILTGGKYSAEEQRLISENRGCAGNRFIKQYRMNEGTTATTTDDKYLTMTVRPAINEGRVDRSDDIARFEIYAITENGMDFAACQNAIEAFQDPGGLGPAESDVEACVGFDAGSGSNANVEHVVYHKAIQECWFYAKHGSWKGGNDHPLKTCPLLYEDGVSPLGISPFDPSYVCYGVYDAGPHDQRAGFVGRCWETTPPVGSGTCLPKTCSQACASSPCYFEVGGVTHRCLADGFEDYCAGNYDSKKEECKLGSDKNAWVDMYEDSATQAPCTPVVITPSTDDWSANLDGVAGDIAPEPDKDAVAQVCVDQAMHDFCLQATTPEVIDPSDAATTTSDYWNLPAILVDTGLAGQLGGRPVSTMKIQVKQDTQPQGILHSTAGELRIGAMAFNSVGAATECAGTNPSDSIVEYCTADNKDGAQVISEIKLGSVVTDTNGTDVTSDDRTHVDDLAAAINDVRATSWTPLAEAMYNAIGYYTQNSAMRLNTDDFPVGDGHDPVTNWCQSNNILVITEGASTADINEQVKGFITGTAIIDDNDTEIGTCPNGLAGSTYLDDLTNHAQHAMASQLYPAGKSQLQTLDGELKDKQNITTYVVASGGLRGSVEGDECTPAALISNAAANGGTTYYDSASPEQLENDLLAIFNALRQRASSGSAASVISSSRGGEGAIYQAIFWPELKRMDAVGTEHSVAWTGDVHALFVDSHGFMYEDTNGDHAMTSADKRVMIYFDEVSGKSKACYNTENWLGTCPDTPVDIQDVKYIWSAGEWLSGLLAADTSVNRTYLSSDQKRYIYTWNDLNNDGIVDRATEWLPFEARTDWHSLAGSGRSSVPFDFDVVTADVASDTTAQNAKVNDIVNWVRGRDRLTAVNLNGNAVTTDDGEAPLRSRQIPISEGSPSKVTARLGDIIHSTPMTVSSPAEGFHLIYNDFSYAEFVKKYKQRRHVVYFGSNDGMLHAVNGGFYDEHNKKFCLTVDCQGEDGNVPALGAELWAYVPYNLLPHLSSLTNPDYGNPKLKNHKYFVDLRPRIFDVQIFPDDGIDGMHPNGWGTILVGGMRLGGAPIDASELHNASADDIRQFISSYFIFDITDPEQPPVLLGEMTRTKQQQSGVDVDADLGHSLAIPTMVIMRDKTDPQTAEKNQWYLVFGSGPHAPMGSNAAMKGISDQNARLAVLPLDWLVKTPTALRIPAAPPTATAGGTIVLGESPKGFISDLVTIDGDINPTSTSFMADAVYFGTNEGDYTDGFKGRIYRLMTRKNLDAAGNDTVDYLFGTDIDQIITTPNQWKVSTLMNVGQPVNAAPSVGYDGHNFWLYVGTGRFFDGDDRTNASQQSFYGIKEPMALIKPVSGNPYMKFFGGSVVAPVAAAHGDISAARIWPVATNASGSKGLLKVDEIRVAQANAPSLAALSCRGSNTLDCIPSSMVTASKTTLADLTSYIAGPDPATDDTNLFNSTDGWYVDYFPYGNRERNLGQATLFGGLVTFTTYQPFLDPCQAEGKAFLYTLYYQTGTAWHEAIFGNVFGLYGDNTTVREKMDLGRGLSTTPNLHVSGDGDSVTAMVQTSTGVIVEQKMDEMATDNYFTGRTGWKECTE